MMRRLHFEEAQQSHFAINAARESGEIKDDNESALLAEEFQSLLAEMSGQAVAITDQVSALGFALAQSAIPQKAKQEDPSYQDNQRDDYQRDDNQLGADNDSNNQDASLNTSGSGVNGVRDRREDDGLDTKLEYKESSKLREQVVVEDIQGSSNLHYLAKDLNLDDTQMISSEESLALNIADSETLAEVSSDLSGMMGQEIVEYKPEGGIQTQQITTPLENQEVGRVIKGNKSENKVDDQTEEVDLFAIAPQAQSDLKESAEITRQKTASGARDKDAAESSLVSNQTASAAANIAQINSPDSRNSATSSTSSEQEDFKSNTEARKLSDSEKSTKNGDIKSDDAFLEGFNQNSQSQSPVKQNNEMIQTVMLRHTFETLRASVNDSFDNQRVRQQSQTVQGVAAAAEAKSAQNEGPNRGKPLTRPQITRMLERVESTLKEAARSRDGKTLSLRLEPVDLGKVKVDVSLRDGALHARISPENQQVMQSLREHAHELQGALRKLGLDVDSVSVSVTANEFSGEMTSGQGTFDGSSFQQERNNMPQERGQLAENTIGNKLAESLSAGGQSKASKVVEMADHWIA